MERNGFWWSTAYRMLPKHRWALEEIKGNTIDGIVVDLEVVTGARAEQTRAAILAGIEKELSSVEGAANVMKKIYDMSEIRLLVWAHVALCDALVKNGGSSLNPELAESLVPVVEWIRGREDRSVRRALADRIYRLQAQEIMGIPVYFPFRGVGHAIDPGSSRRQLLAGANAAVMWTILSLNVLIAPPEEGQPLDYPRFEEIVRAALLQSIVTFPVYDP